MKSYITIATLIIFNTVFSQRSHQYHNDYRSSTKVNSIKPSDNKNKTILDISYEYIWDWRYEPQPAIVNSKGYVEILSKKEIKGVADIHASEYFKVNELMTYQFMDDFPEMISVKCYDDTLMLPCDSLKELKPINVFMDKDYNIYSIYYNYFGNQYFSGSYNYLDHYSDKILYTKHKAVFQNNTIVRGELLKSKIYEDTAALTPNKPFIIQTGIPLIPISSNIILSSNPFEDPYSTSLNILDSNFNKKKVLDLKYTTNDSVYNLNIVRNYQANFIYIKSFNDTIIAICDGYLDSLVLLKLDTGFNLISATPYIKKDVVIQGNIFSYDSIADYYFDEDPEVDMIPVSLNDSMQYFQYNFYDAQGNLSDTLMEDLNFDNFSAYYYNSIPIITSDKKMISLIFVNDNSFFYSKMDVYVKIKDLISKKSKTIKLPNDYFKDGGYNADLGYHVLNVPIKIDSFNNVLGFFNYEETQTLGTIYNMALIGFNLDYLNAASGTVAFDLNRNCIKDSAENPVANILVELSFKGHSYFQTTDNTGAFYISPYDTGHGKVILHLENQSTYINACQDTFDVYISDTSQNPEINFLVQTPSCGHPTPKLNVEISTPFLRRCFDNNYTLSVFNESSDTAFNSYVDIELDEHLIATDTAFSSAQNLGNNRYRLYFGNVSPLQTIRKQLKVKVDCDSTILGQTHCVKVTAFPYETCLLIDLPRINATAICRNDSVFFYIGNEGARNAFDFPYRILQNDSVVINGNLHFSTLQFGDVISIYNPQGKTVRLEGRQFPMYQNEDTLVSVTIEGCGKPDFSTGYVNLFSQDDDAPNVDIDCHQNVGSFDPNEKTAQPSGFGDSLYILPNTPIEYTIHFQNKGTFAASYITITDTLSAFFDITTFQMLSSSHPFTYAIIDSNILQFTSTSINLPAEQNDTLGSNGYIKFKVSPKKNIPTGTTIKNTASISFDFNTPIITNTVIRNVNDDFLKVKIISAVKNNLTKIKTTVYPNPFDQTATLSFDFQQPTQLTIFSIDGKIVQQYQSTDNFYSIDRKQLSNGMYLYELKKRSSNEILDTGKLVIQ